MKFHPVKIKLHTLLVVAAMLIATPLYADGTWDGGGGDNNVDTAANWTGDTLPPFSSTTGTLTFASDAGDDTASINVAISDIVEITFAGSDSDFTIADGGGSLTFSSGGTITNNASGHNHTIAIDIATAGLTVNSATNDVTISGAISGTTITKTGDGILYLTGTNAYTGDVTISAGTVSGSTTSILNNVSVASGASVIFNQATDATFAGVISGAGDFTKSGVGNLTLSGANTYTGGTTVSAGTLTGTTTSLQGAITNNSAVVFDQDTDGTYSAVMTGSGTLTKSGTGTLTLSGNNSHTGTTTLSAGILNLTGQVGGNVVVNAGTLMGTGSITGTGTLTVNSGATVAPGASIGTLTVAGAFNLNAGSYLDVEISKNAAGTRTQDLVASSGAVTLASGSYIRVTDLSTENFIDTGDTFTIITGTSVTDSGTSILDYSASLSFAASISGGTDYVLTATRTAFAASATDSGNRKLLGAVDSSLNSSAFTSDTALVNQLSKLSATGLNDAAEQLSPLAHSTSAALASQMSQRLSSNLSSYLGARRSSSSYAASDSQVYLADASNDPELLGSVMRENKKRKASAKQTNYFFRPFGTYFDHDSSDDFVGFDATSVGAQFGYDTLAEDNLILGLGGSYAHSFINYDDSHGEADVDSFVFTPYASYFNDNWFVDGSISFGYHHNKSEREIKIGSLRRTAEATYNAYEFGTFIKTGYKFYQNDWAITPYTSLQYTYYHSDSFEEDGAGSAGLEVDDSTQQSLLGRLGLNLSTIAMIDNLQVAPEVYVGYAHQFIKEDSVDAKFVNGTTKFSTDVDSDRDDSVYYGAGVSSLISEDISAYFGYEGETFTNNQTHALNAALTVRF